MPVTFNDIKRRFNSSRPSLFAAWGDLLDSGIYIGGKRVEQFEREFAKYCGSPHCVSLANGTDALEFGLRALNVEAGDEVITVANAGGYTSAACHAIGAVPVYIDVDPFTCQLDPTWIDHASSGRIRVIVITHLYGLMNDVASVRQRLESLGRTDVAIFEDCAQAHGASDSGRFAGTIGELAAFSFYPTKNLGALGDAGAVLCRDADVATRIRQLRQYGWNAKYQTVIPGGRNSRLDPLQAIVLLQQLEGLADGNSKRRMVCQFYAENIPGGWTIVQGEGSRFVGHLAVAIAPNRTSWEAARELLTQRNIGHDVHYPYLDCEQSGWQGLGRCVGDLKESRTLTHKILSLPCFAEMTEGEIGEVAEALRHFPVED